MSSSYIYLFASVGVLFLGPVVYRTWRHKPSLLALLDGFVLGGVGGLVLFDVLPHAVEEASWMAVLAAGIGLLGPFAAERSRFKALRGTHSLVLLVSMLGIAIHGMLDGAALAPLVVAGREGSDMLSMAVVLHRVPVGIAVWWIVRPSAGRLWAFATLGAIALATVVGFGLSSFFAAGLHGSGSAILQALVGGALLHVVLHRHAPAELRHSYAGGDSSRSGLFEGLGVAAAVGFLVALHAVADPHVVHEVAHGAECLHDHAHDVVGGASYGMALWQLVLLSAPALLLGYLIAGALSVFVPKASFRWMGRGSHLSQSARGMAFGLPLPICSCGVVPVYRGLVAEKVPATAAMAFLIATPELGLESMLLSVPLLGADLAIARIGSAAAVALLVGWLVGRRVLRDQAANGAPALPETGMEPLGDLSRPSFKAKITSMLRVGLVDSVRETGPWIVIGLVVAAAMAPLPLERAFEGLPPGADVVLFALIGMPIYICASGSTPLAAMLVLKGLSPGAAIAFLLTGPATNLTTFGVLADVHGKKHALRFAVMVAVLSIIIGLGVNQFLTADVLESALEHGDHEGGLLSWAAVLVLGAAFAASVLRVGPRAYFGSIFKNRDPSANGADSQRPEPVESGSSCCSSAGADAADTASDHDCCKGESDSAESAEACGCSARDEAPKAESSCCSAPEEAPKAESSCCGAPVEAPKAAACCRGDKDD